jgi:type IV pilus assembly protein PilN
MLIGKSIGVILEESTLKLSLLYRQFNRVTVLDLLSLPDCLTASPEDLRKPVADFLRRNKAEQIRSVLLIPRRDIIVRQVDLPKEAEANLAKVVEYQLVNLVPSQEAAIVYDYLVDGRHSESKSLQVTIFLVLRSILDFSLGLCEKLGLKVARVLPTSIAISNYFALFHGNFKVETALFGYRGDGVLETVGLQKRVFSHSRESRFAGRDGLAEIELREREQSRSQLGIPENAALDIFCSGARSEEAPEALDGQRFRWHPLSRAQRLGLRVARAELEGLKLQNHFLAVAAAVSGLFRKLPAPVNLLPAEKRTRNARWVLVPTYGLAGINLLLLLLLVARKPIQQEAYLQQLQQEVARLEPEVRKIRSVEKEIGDLRQRSEIITGFRKSNDMALAALNELSIVLPETTFVMDFTLKDQTIEINGMSESAAALPQILDNSPYFKGAEFIAPITRDGSGRELYRIRMQLEGTPGVATMAGAPTGAAIGTGTRERVSVQGETRGTRKPPSPGVRK